MSSPGFALARPLSIVTIGLDREILAGLKQVVSSLKGFEFIAEVSAQTHEKSNASAVMESLRQRKPDICVIDFDSNRERCGTTAEQIRSRLPGVVVFALSADSNPEAIITAMHSGCSEYLLKPLNRDRIVEALNKVDHNKRGREAVKKAAMYTFIGAKGGTGVTTLATHLATFAAKSGARTLLIDHHTDLGDICVYLSLGEHLYDFYELVHNTHRMDADLLQGFIVRHASGVEVLASPSAMGTTTQVSPAALEATLAFLKQIYDVILIDCAPGLSALNVSAIERSDAVYLIATPELPSIRNLSRYLEHLRQYNCPEEKIRIVVNRYSKRASITQQQVEKAVRMQVALVVPNDYANILEAINMGTPIPPDTKSELATTFRDWTAALLGTKPQNVAQEPKRRFAAMFGI
ncbi:MAG TPA: AAA family ATPase [Clostridia bacterium]|nr:AAA family ATPase [Clostridia bacterium]